MYVSVCVENVLCMYNIVITMDITGIGSYWPLPKLSTNHSHIRSPRSPQICSWDPLLERLLFLDGLWATALGKPPCPCHPLPIPSG